LCALSALASSQGQSQSTVAPSAADIPHLRKQGTATQLIVDGQPFLALASELSNNGATSSEYLKPLVAQVSSPPVLTLSWPAFPGLRFEPQEGKFDFTAVDGVIQDARSYKLRLRVSVVRHVEERYPPATRRLAEAGFRAVPARPARRREKHGIASAPSARPTGTPMPAAFAALIAPRQGSGRRDHTVITIQVENEVGMERDSRDRSPAAIQAYEGPVPRELMDYLQQHKDSLNPEFREVWQSAGFKTSGTWEQVFGASLATDEIFTAWSYARYVGRVAAAGKAEYPLPMYMNAYTYGFRRQANPRPRAAAPMPELFDVWRAGAPSIDIFSPDNSHDFVTMSAKYTQSGNPLFIPEESPGPEGAARALYAFGRHDAICYSRMSGGVDRVTTPDLDLGGSYDLIAQLAPLISAHQGDGTMSAVYLGPNDPPQKVKVGNYTLEATFFGAQRLGPAHKPPENPRPARPPFSSRRDRTSFFRGRQRRGRHVYPEHTRAPAGRTGPRWKKGFL